MQIRIITFEPDTEFIKQREKDETNNGVGDITFNMSNEINELIKWVEKVKTDIPKADIQIKYLPTYPSISYLRIDNAIFYGPNLPLKKSQQNIGLEFKKMGKGYSYFEEYFTELWENRKYCKEIENK